MSEIAGRVLMIPKGTYSPTTTYDPLDAVNYEHNSYVCKQTSRGNLPTNTTYWQPLTDVTADEIPTEGSTNLVQSGGVYSANQTLTNNVDVLIENGAINLLPIKCPSQTQNNVTLTNNNDGSVTVSGTASENTYFYLLGKATSHLENIEGTGKSYTLSGCTSGSDSTYALRMLGGTVLGSWLTVGQIQTTEEMTFTEGTYPYYAVRLDVFSGASVNVTIKPMLVDSKYKGAYQPYAKTNKELTDDILDLDTSVKFLQDTNKLTDGYATASGAISTSLSAIGLTAQKTLWGWLQGLRTYYDNPYGLRIIVSGNQMILSSTTCQMWLDVMGIFDVMNLLDPLVEIDFTNLNSGRGYLKLTTNDLTVKMFYFSDWEKVGSIKTFTMT